MERTNWIDVAGGLAGGLCAVHCAVMALLPGLIGGTGLFFLGDTRLEIALVGGALLMTGWIVLSGAIRHLHPGVLVLFAVAGVLLLLGLVSHDLQLGMYGTSFSITGGVLLVGTHLCNAICRANCGICESSST